MTRWEYMEDGTTFKDLQSMPGHMSVNMSVHMPTHLTGRRSRLNDGTKFINSKTNVHTPATHMPIHMFMHMSERLQACTQFFSCFKNPTACPLRGYGRNGHAVGFKRV